MTPAHLLTESSQHPWEASSVRVTPLLQVRGQTHSVCPRTPRYRVAASVQALQRCPLSPGIHTGYVCQARAQVYHVILSLTLRLQLSSPPLASEASIQHLPNIRGGGAGHLSKAGTAASTWRCTAVRNPDTDWDYGAWKTVSAMNVLLTWLWASVVSPGRSKPRAT